MISFKNSQNQNHNSHFPYFLLEQKTNFWFVSPVVARLNLNSSILLPKPKYPFLIPIIPFPFPFSDPFPSQTPSPFNFPESFHQNYFVKPSLKQYIKILCINGNLENNKCPDRNMEM